MVSQSDQFVFILGAGFSAAAGLPVMAQFADSARRRYFTLTPQDTPGTIAACYDALFNFQQECERSSGAFLRDWENIEELYTQADLRRLSGIPDQAKCQDLCGNIAWTLWDVYRGGTRPHGHLGPLDIFGTVATNVRARHKLSCTVITTNYDVVAEAAILKSRGRISHPGFDLQSPSSIGWLNFVSNTPARQREADDIEVVKLHGSVHWFEVGDRWYCSRNIVPSGDRNSVTSPGVSHAHARAEAGGCNTSVAQTEVRPAIIPPMLGKSSARPVVAEQWRTAIAALRRARYVVIIGYSFPETDTFMTRLLAEGMHSNDDMDRLVIVDIANVDEWRQKASRLFAPVFLRKKVAYVQISAVDALAVLDEGGPKRLLEKRSF